MSAKNSPPLGPDEIAGKAFPPVELEGQSRQMLNNANRTTEFLKSLAHAGRLMILCRLAESSATVGQLEKMLDMSQSSVSKQLARLREEKIVETTRKGRSIYYSLADDKARRVVSTLYELFCEPN
ncbi:MAG TPA: transcriptional regulator, partial [Devosia sp.]|nr:transcriptional regulator [Devosia sp.]